MDTPKAAAELGNEKLSIRLKCGLQNLTVRDLSSTIIVGDFLQELSTLTGIAPNEIALLRGFPPKRILYQDSMTLRDIGIVNRDTVIIESDKSGQPGGYPTPTSESTESDPERTISISDRIKSIASSIDSKTFNLEKRLEVPPTTVPNRGMASNSLGSAKGGKPNRDQDDSQPIVHRLIDFPESPVVPLGSVGVVMRKVIPSDNSCLFSAITFCRTGIANTSSAELRELIASTVLQDPIKYNEGYLGRSNLEYVEWISRLDSWGGGIELAILSAHFRLLINVMDAQHLRINRFGEDQDYSLCIFLIYDGIHYDALYLECYDGSGIVTVFPVGDNSIYDQVMDFGREANVARQYTDLNNFKLRCQICDKRCMDSNEAQNHAKATGHKAFSEI